MRVPLLIGAATAAFVCCHAVAVEPFKPEQLVISTKGKPLVACMQEGDLRKVVAHLNAGEKTKASAMFSGACFTLEPGQAYKVLSVKPGIIEVGLVAQKDPDGIWVLPGSFTAAQR